MHVLLAAQPHYLPVLFICGGRSEYIALSGPAIYVTRVDPSMTEVTLARNGDDAAALCTMRIMLPGASAEVRHREHLVPSYPVVVVGCTAVAVGHT